MDQNQTSQDGAEPVLRVPKFKSGLISKSKVRRFILDYAKVKRAHKFSRVSDDVYFQAEASLKRWCQQRVADQPSAGKTIM